MRFRLRGHCYRLVWAGPASQYVGHVNFGDGTSNLRVWRGAKYRFGEPAA